MSLLQLDLRDNTIEVHDVLTAVADERVSDLRSLHRRLVESWGDLSELREGDAYTWRWIVYHVAAAGVQDRLRPALFDPCLD